MVLESHYSILALRGSSDTFVREQGLQFSYGNATYESYSECYRRRDEGAYVPRALLAGVIQPVYHLARGIIYEMPSTIKGDFAPLKSALYSTVRDLQEALGWITALFHEKLGFYLIDGSTFHRSCYDLVINESALKRIKERVESLSIEELQELVNREGYSILQFATDEQLPQIDFSRCVDVAAIHQIFSSTSSLEAQRRFGLLTPKQLNAIMNYISLGAAYTPFQPTDGQIRGLLSLQDSNMPACLFSTVLDQFMIARFIAAMTTDQVNGFFQRVVDTHSYGALSMIPKGRLAELPIKKEHIRHLFPTGWGSDARVQQERLSGLTPKQLEELDLQAVAFFKNRTSHPLNDFRAEEIERILSYLSPEHLKSLSGERIGEFSDQGLDYLIEKAQLLSWVPADLFSLLHDRKRLPNYTETTRFRGFLAQFKGEAGRERFSYLPDEWLMKNIEGVTQNNMWWCLSKRQRHSIDFSKLSSDARNCLPIFGSTTNGPDRDKVKSFLDSMAAKQLQDVLTQLTPAVLPLISKDQLRQLDISVLSQDKVTALFAWTTDHGEEKQRARWLSLPDEMRQHLESTDNPTIAGLAYEDSHSS